MDGQILIEMERERERDIEEVCKSLVEKPESKRASITVI